MRKEIFLPALAVAGGAVGFGLRKLELSTAFDVDTGLHIAGSSATTTLVVLTVLMFGLLFFLSQGERRRFRGSFDDAFIAEENTLYATTGVLSAFLLACAGVALIWYFIKGYDSSVTKLMLAFLCLVSCPCVMATVKNNFKGERQGKYNFTLLVPAYTCCMWLVAAYQDRAADPVILDYVYELLAIIAILLSLYHLASFSFERGSVHRTTFFSLMAVYFSMVTLADPHDPAEFILFGFGVLYLTGSTALMRYNTRRQMPTKLTREVPSDDS